MRRSASSTCTSRNARPSSGRAMASTAALNSSLTPLTVTTRMVVSGPSTMAIGSTRAPGLHSRQGRRHRRGAETRLDVARLQWLDGRTRVHPHVVVQAAGPERRLEVVRRERLHAREHDLARRHLLAALHGHRDELFAFGRRGHRRFDTAADEVAPHEVVGDGPAYLVGAEAVEHAVRPRAFQFAAQPLGHVGADHAELGMRAARDAKAEADAPVAGDPACATRGHAPRGSRAPDTTTAAARCLRAT